MVAARETSRMTDGELVRLARAGRTPALAELTRRWTGRVLALCHARVRQSDAAEDLAQETLLRGLRGLRTLSEPEKFGPWLCGIAHRVCLTWLRRRPRAAVPFSALGAEGAALDGAVDGGAPARLLEQAENLDRLWQAINNLPADFRETLLLYYYQDGTYQDLADQLGVSAATINARLTKARALLRERLVEVAE
jgi:RNA polymerase sigma-70 factor (ECF subfamily)